MRKKRGPIQKIDRFAIDITKGLHEGVFAGRLATEYRVNPHLSKGSTHFHVSTEDDDNYLVIVKRVGRPVTR